MEHLYSIIPLLEDHFDERAADVINQYKQKITSCPLFMMVILPEGDPVWNKVDRLCAIYARYRDELAKEGVPSGVLIQATFGHGNSAALPAPYQKMVGFNNGVTQKNVYCPLDPENIEYLSNAIKRIAMENPKAIMLDDDVRLIMRRHEGCACPLHMREFNRINKTDMTREELYEYVMSHPDRDPLTLSFVKLQENTLINAVTLFRQAIDSVNPEIQGINCTSGDECDSVIYTNPIFAGKNNPTVVRCPNGTYAPLTTKRFSNTMRRAAVCGSKLRKNGIDIVLAETDTVPFNRYSKNARYLHAHFTASLLEGVKGTKHWITRTTGYEPKSGLAFRKILAEHAAYYDEVARISDEIRWVGANSAFIEQNVHRFHHEDIEEIWRFHDNTWAECVFERKGIPFYFSDDQHKASFLEGDIVRDMTDEQIKAVFSGSVFCASDAAMDLIDRGFGDLLGVSVREYEGGIITGETYDGTLEIISSRQKYAKELVPNKDGVEALSHCYRRVDGKAVLLFPAVTRYKRADGNFSVVFCGTPNTEFKYTEAFSFLNETRKKQLVGLLSDVGELPVYCESDNELCLRAGYLKDGRLLTAIFNIGFDPEEKISFHLEKAPTEAKRLEKDGSYADVAFRKTGDGVYEFDASAEPMYPTIILIK